MRRCVPWLNTLRHDDLFSPFPSKLFNIFRMIWIFSLLSLFFDCLRTAAYHGPHTLFRKTSLKRVTEAYPCFFLIFWVLCGQPLGNRIDVARTPLCSMLTGTGVRTPPRTCGIFMKRSSNRLAPQVGWGAL